MPYVPHKYGRPARGDEPTSSRTIRFTFEELSSMEAHGEVFGFTRAELVRAACAEAGLFDEPSKGAPSAFMRRLLRRREREERTRAKRSA